MPGQVHKQSHHLLLRKITGAMAVFGGVEVLNILCSVVRTKFVALWIGAAGIGLFGLYNSVVEMFTTLAQMGVRSSGVKEIAGAAPSMRSRVIYVVRRYGVYLALGGLLLTIVCSPVLSYVGFGDTERWWVFAILSVAVMSNVLALSTSAVLQGVHRIKRIARAAMTATVISLAIAVPVIYIWRMDGVLPVVVIYAVVSMLCYFVMRHREAAPVPLPTRSEEHRIAGSVIRLGAYLTIAGFMTWLVSYLVMSFMNYVGGETLMGYYQSGFTMSVKYAGIVFSAMAMEYFPRISEAFSRGHRSLSVMVRYQCVVTVFIITALALIMASFAPLIVELLYSRDFEPVVPVVILSTPGLIFRGVSWCMSYMIIASGDGKVFLLSEVTSGIICLALNVVCWYLWGLPGIGVSFTLWYMAYTAIVWVITRRRYGFSFGLRPAMILVFAVVLVAGISAVSLYAGMLWSIVAAVCVLSGQFLLYLRYARAKRV